MTTELEFHSIATQFLHLDYENFKNEMKKHKPKDMSDYEFYQLLYEA